MKNWNKKKVTKSEIEELEKKYGLDPLTASIFVRRNILNGRDLLYFLEDDLRYQHSPFSFTTMEDAVDRILNAKEEGEKVLIFGDRDVDGVSSTTILYDCLKEMGIDVSYRLPEGNDAYGLSMQAVDDFAKESGTLIITVDCGISNAQEVSHAAELGIDVIVTDHHNPPEILPNSAIIINPKVTECEYPFKDISGAAVAFKLASALRFSQSQFYKEEITLMNVEPVNEAFKIECLKIRNLVPQSRISETIVPGTISIMQTRLPDFLSGQQIFVWDGETNKKFLKETFGSSVEFNFIDIREEIVKIFPWVQGISLLRLKEMSRIAKYGNHPATETGSFYNLFVTFCQQKIKMSAPQFVKAEEKDLQLVGLAAIADIMPLKDENRIFVRKALSFINSGKSRPGLLELLSHLNLLGKRITSTTLSWDVVSNLNAAGRLGHPEYAAELFLSKDAGQRETMAKKIIELNAQRKQLTNDAVSFAAIQAGASISNFNNKLCLVIDERINRGVSGILAGRLVSQYNVPAIVVTFVEDNAIGSMRSCRGYDLTNFMNSLSDIFTSYGGHAFATGFSFERSKLNDFEKRVKELSQLIELEEENQNTIEVDAEIPPSYLTPKLLEITDRFEPFGEENKELIFMAKNVHVQDAKVLGNTEKLHLKLTLDGANCKWPALFWNEGERLHKEFEIGDKIDILFHVERNFFNGIESVQMILIDLKKSTGDNK